ncbi:hypothetical protein GC163_23370 [bacterium]|nr:hypothetical protein [bacterium]
MQILVVSHVPPLRRSLRATLERAQHRTMVAESLDEAVKILSVNLSIDVVISEWNFITGTAMELQIRCNQIDRLADTQQSVAIPHFLVLATPRLNGNISEGRGAVPEIQAFGFTDVYEKPIDHARILSRLESIHRERLRSGKMKADPTEESVGETESKAPAPEVAARLMQLEAEIASLGNSLREQNQVLEQLQMKITTKT